MDKLLNKIAVVTVTDYRDYPRYFWEEILREKCEEFLWFDLEKEYFNNGKKKTQEKLLNFLEKEKPDYVFMFDSLFYDLDLLSIFTKMKEISPKTKTVCFAGDDDFTFDASRYLALFFDYYLVAQNDFIPLYEKDGLSNSFFITQITPCNINKNAKKIYDVSFIGAPKSDRKEIIEYLMNRGIDISLFGAPGWNKHHEIKNIYKGPLSSEDLPITVDKTKINICLSTNMAGVPHMKGRFLEYLECKAFSLVEYSPQMAELFKENKEVVFFRGKEDLVKKIKYYLKNPKEREKIIDAGYKKLKSKFDFRKELDKFIKKTKNESKRDSLPKLDATIINLDEGSMRLSKKDLLEKIGNDEYISFSKGDVLKSKFKDYLQIYSLIKNNKDISCCDYFISSKSMGDIGRFRYCPFGKLDGAKYNIFLDINQVVVSRKYFIKNFNVLKKSYITNEVRFINNDNTAFVSVPLLKIIKFRKGFFNNPEFLNDLGLFLFSFHRELYSRRKRPLKMFIYSFFLFKEIFFGKTFIFKYLIKNLRR